MLHTAESVRLTPVAVARTANRAAAHICSALAVGPAVRWATRALCA